MSIILCSRDDVESDIIDPWLIDSQEYITISSYFLCWDVVISYLTFLCINKCVIVKFETYLTIKWLLYSYIST
jgi:hypothetical protein